MLLLSHQENQLQIYRSWALYSLRGGSAHPIFDFAPAPGAYKHHLLNMCQFSDCLVAAPANTDLIVKPYFSPNTHELLRMQSCIAQACMHLRMTRYISGYTLGRPPCDQT